ncbi:hypothetical protein [Pseudofrankia asymbiotica]|uniref:Uncharacterized protein n=1 Tax=Pseudofrankia asymbiotica TaxID=1834516 RepID=A0A1V2I8R2_9ACTN|nr:hypothetical protein [Pseudofrankia asymbiotica]ONH28639.1 hypothetical protein BL253_18805 [Pseudofrankia asymbiotica]
MTRGTTTIDDQTVDHLLTESGGLPAGALDDAAAAVPPMADADVPIASTVFTVSVAFAVSVASVFA